MKLFQVALAMFYELYHCLKETPAVFLPQVEIWKRYHSAITDGG